MKIKLAYPKIPNTLDCPLKQCVAFEKLDGTNIHFVFHPHVGWLEFGTRRDRFALCESGIKQFEQAHPELAGLDEVWNQNSNMDKLEYFLTEHPEYSKAKEIIVFAEYFGKNSFAGKHKREDEKQLTIFDVQVDGIMLPPEQFIENFQAFGIPKVVFQGKFSGQLYVDVRNGKYKVEEGVVVKGVVDDKVYMAKIKTHAYAKKLMERFENDWKEYWE